MNRLASPPEWSERPARLLLGTAFSALSEGWRSRFLLALAYGLAGLEAGVAFTVADGTTFGTFGR